MLHLQSSINRILPSHRFNFRPSRVLLILAGLALNILAFSPAVLAHHPLGGRAPSSFLEGFLSGVGHPLIGLDHFAFVVAVGLLASFSYQRLIIPVAFISASLIGTGIHLQSLDLPAPEFFIAASVVIFGILLALKTKVSSGIVAVLAVFAGVFHGYAYGEAIVGAPMGSLFAYLLGFSGIQLLISLGACAIGYQVLTRRQQMPEIPLRFAGFMICGLGIAFLSTALLG